MNFLLQIKIASQNLSTMINLEGIFEEGIEDFIRYEKNKQEKKSRQEKRKQKVERLTTDLRDPQQRRQRHQLRRQQEKAKLQKQLQGMSEQQCRQYLDKKKEAKKLAKQRNLKALQTGMPILIDAVFEDRMNSKQNKSLAIQIQLIIKSIKHIEDPPGIHLCSVGGTLKAQLQKMNYQYWTLTSSSQSVVEVAKKLNKKPVYLSPDAAQQLQEIDPNAAYILGGLVDRTVIKNASLNRAQDLEINSVRLPIRQYMKSRTCLNLDHVVMMLCKFKQTNDWKTAFDFGAPKRWKRQESRKNNKIKQKQSPNSSENQQEDQNEQEEKKQSPHTTENLQTIYQQNKKQQDIGR